MQVDYVEIADAADLSSAIAQRKLALLLRNRLIYPDGSVAKAALAALQAAVRARVKTPKETSSAQQRPTKGEKLN
jgi:hypothetical protein